MPRIRGFNYCHKLLHATDSLLVQPSPRHAFDAQRAHCNKTCGDLTPWQRAAAESPSPLPISFLSCATAAAKDILVPCAKRGKAGGEGR